MESVLHPPEGLVRLTPSAKCNDDRESIDNSQVGESRARRRVLVRVFLATGQDDEVGDLGEGPLSAAKRNDGRAP